MDDLFAFEGADDLARVWAEGLRPDPALMRQTLLGWQISEHRDHGCSSYRNVHVVPDANLEFHQGVTAPGLTGTDVSGAWRRVLKQPELYLPVSPEKMIRPIQELSGTDELLSYLERRYWSGG